MKGLLVIISFYRRQTEVQTGKRPCVGWALTLCGILSSYFLFSGLMISLSKRLVQTLSSGTLQEFTQSVGLPPLPEVTSS